VEHKGRYTRGYLPHCDFPDSVQAITFRLADSIARRLLDSWHRAASNGFAKEGARAELLRKIARYEDAGHGECLLRSSEVASIIQEQLIAGHGESYRLIECA
jgi:putative transposase